MSNEAYLRKIIQQILYQRDEIWQRGPSFENSFFVRAIGRKYANNGIRRLPVGIELKVILPNRAILGYIKTIADQTSQLTSMTSPGLEHYVTFTRANFHPLDKLACDWCAIANGVLVWTDRLLDEALDSADPRLEDWRFDASHLYGKVFSALRLLPLSVVRKTYDKGLLSGQLAAMHYKLEQNFTAEQSKIILPVLRRFVQIRHILECIEKRWCPFQHLREIAYAYDHQVVNCQRPEQVRLAARLLAEQGKISCHECAAVFEKSPQISADDTPSILGDYFNLLRQISAGGF